jgi:hypothetical protein
MCSDALGQRELKIKVNTLTAVNESSSKMLEKLKRLYTQHLNMASVPVAFFSRRKVATAILAAVAVITIAGLLLVQVTSIIQTSSTLSSVGTIKGAGIGVYWDAGFANRTTAINWGTLDPGSQKAFTVYIRNEGSSAITLSQSASNWNPSSASNYLTLTWNYNGQTINAGSSIQVTMTLTASSTITGIATFSFDIILIGSG